MKRTVIAVGVLLLAVLTAQADIKSNPYGGSGNAFTLYVIDTDIDTAIEIADADTGFTPLKANGTIRALYTAANTDTAYLHISGLRADSTWTDTVMLCPGHQPQTTAATFMAFEQAWLNQEKAGVTTVYSTATSATSMLRSISAGVLHEPIAQVYSGKRGLFLESVQFTHLSAIDTTSWELRIYPDIADHRDFADGYEVRYSSRLHTNAATSGTIPLDTYLPNNSWAAVFAKSSAANGSGSVLLKYRR